MSAPTENAQTREISEEYRKVFQEVLAEAVHIVESEGIPYVLAGSVASIPDSAIRRLLQGLYPAA